MLGVVDMFGIILSGGKLFGAIVAIGAGVLLVVRVIWSIYKGIKRIEAIVKLTNDETLTELARKAERTAKAVEDVKHIIGTNGGATIFQRLSEQDLSIAELKHQAAVNAQAAADKA